MIFWIVPVAVLAAALAGIGVMTGTWWPWNVVVHEDGVRTLLGTMFFVEHAARELIPDAVLALAVAGAVRFHFPAPASRSGSNSSRWRPVLLLVLILSLIGIIGGTLWTAGLQPLIDNLSQLHTRAGAPLVWGAHWRYHLIDRFALMMLAFSVCGVVWLLNPRHRHQTKGRFTYFAAALMAFAILTIIFRPTAEPFRDPAFLGHQLRELFTHALVTVPLAMGTCLALVRTSTHPVPGTGHLPPGTAICGSLAILSGAFLLVASLMTDAQSHGQATGLAWLLLPHFFEHFLGYVFVPALAGVLSVLYNV